MSGPVFLACMFFVLNICLVPNRSRHSTGVARETAAWPARARGAEVRRKHESFCSIGNYSEFDLNHVLSQSVQVSVPDGFDWTISPYSFYLPNKQTRAEGKHSTNLRNVVVIIVESLAPHEMQWKLPRTLQYLSEQSTNGDVLGHLFSMKRVGINSTPNRGALLLGHSYPRYFRNGGRNSRRNVAVSLIDQALVAGMDILISETVERPCQHYANTMSILGIGCVDSHFQAAYAEVMDAANCQLANEKIHGKKCPRFPYPSKDLPNNCSNVGVHHVIASQLQRQLQLSNGLLAILNFLDFHPPMLDYYSPDLDAAIASVATNLTHLGEPFSLYVVGDHGHGILSDRGDAAGLFFSSKDQPGQLAQSSISMGEPIISLLTMNKIISSQILNPSSRSRNSCVLEGIPSEYCKTCVEGKNNTTWTYFIPRKMMNITASSTRTFTCKHLDDEYVTEGTEVHLILDERDCFAEFSIHILATQPVEMKPVTSYKPFLECASKRRPLILIVRDAHDSSINITIDLTADPPSLIQGKEDSS